MSLEQAAIAANRFGLGARPGDLARIAGDPKAWLKGQLTPEAALPGAIAALPSTADATAAFPRWIATLGLGGDAGALAKLYQKKPDGPGGMQAGGMQAGGMQAGDAAKAPGLPPGVSVEQSFVKTFYPGYAAAVEARFQVATTTDRPFFERLVRFWTNHFCISAAKPEVIALPPAFERDVIRPHVTGRFEDMLLASSQHPGMLEYLDNFLSIGPNSPLAHHPEVLPAYLRERMKGLNENLGREILELHTLGVRSGYTQADVTTLAKIITGWSIHRGGEAAPDGRLFNFIGYAHEPGPQTLLGKTYPADGVRQGEAALRDLARHPATADHIATKLARHFIADDPPPAAVARLAAVFRDTGGDLGKVSAALVDTPEAWAPAAAKLKTPDDYVVSTVRALGGPPLKGMQLIALLDRMGQKPYYTPGPDGWSDIEASWIGADAVWKRIEWATAIAKGVASANLDPATVANAALGPALSEATLHAIRLAESPSQGLALFLVSPEFQRR